MAMPIFQVPYSTSKPLSGTAFIYSGQFIIFSDYRVYERVKYLVQFSFTDCFFTLESMQPLSEFGLRTLIPLLDILYSIYIPFFCGNSLGIALLKERWIKAGMSWGQKNLSRCRNVTRQNTPGMNWKRGRDMFRPQLKTCMWVVALQIVGTAALADGGIVLLHWQEELWRIGWHQLRLVQNNILRWMFSLMCRWKGANMRGTQSSIMIASACLSMSIINLACCWETSFSFGSIAQMD